MKVVIEININNMSGNTEGPFVSSQVTRTLEVGGAEPTKVVSELIIAMEKAMLEVQSR